MKLLNLDSGDEAATPNKKKSKWLKIGIGLSALVLIPTIGSTLAGSINIGTGSVEFGQGLVQTTACDDDINVAPTSQRSYASTSTSTTLANGSIPGITGPYFSLGTISVSNINGLTCDPVMFIIRAYNSEGAQVPLCSNIDPELLVYFEPNTTEGFIDQSCGSQNDWDTETDENTDGYFEWVPDLTDLYLSASYVNTITIESSSLLCSAYIWCD